MLLKNSQNIKEEFSLYSIYQVLKLNKKFISFFVCGFLILVFLYSFITPYKYETTASIIPPENSGNTGNLASFLQTLSGSISMGAIGQENKVLIFSEILKSRELAKYIADSCHLRDKKNFQVPNDNILYNLIISSIEVQIKRTGLINIIVTLSTPKFPSPEDKEETAQLTAEIANKAIEGLDYITRKKSVSKAKRKRTFIERVLLEKKKVLDSLDRQIEEYQKNHKLLALDEQTKAIITSAAGIGSELAKAEIDLAIRQQEYEPNSPLIKAFQSSVNTLRQQYQRIQTGGIVSGDEFSIPLSNVPSLIRNYSNLIREKKIQEQVNLYLETQRYQEAIQEESDVPTVEPLDKAEVPTERMSPNRTFMLVLGFIIAISFACFIVIIFSFIKGMLYLNKEVKNEN